MPKIDYDEKSFFTISKTAKIIGVQSHVLRFWEKKFHAINPKKNLNGRRYYSSKDIDFLFMIKKLLYEEGFTIKGAVNIVDKKSKKSEIENENLFNEKLSKAINLIKEGSNIIKRNII